MQNNNGQPANFYNNGMNPAQQWNPAAQQQNFEGQPWNQQQSPQWNQAQQNQPMQQQQSQLMQPQQYQPMQQQPNQLMQQQQFQPTQQQQFQPMQQQPNQQTQQQQYQPNQQQQQYLMDQQQNPIQQQQYPMDQQQQQYPMQQQNQFQQQLPNQMQEQNPQQQGNFQYQNQVPPNNQVNTGTQVNLPNRNQPAVPFIGLNGGDYPPRAALTGRGAPSRLSTQTRNNNYPNSNNRFSRNTEQFFDNSQYNPSSGNGNPLVITSSALAMAMQQQTLAGAAIGQICGNCSRPRRRACKPNREFGGIGNLEGVCTVSGFGGKQRRCSTNRGCRGASPSPQIILLQDQTRAFQNPNFQQQQQRTQCRDVIYPPVIIQASIPTAPAAPIAPPPNDNQTFPPNQFQTSGPRRSTNITYNPNPGSANASSTNNSGEKYVGSGGSEQ